MVSLFDVIEDLMVLWIVLGIALIGLVAWLCYRFIPGLRIEKEEVDEKQAAKEELDRFLVPMDEDVEIKEETDEDKKEESHEEVQKDEKVSSRKQ